jgi:NADH:ubiquinone oxidoreductase subunit K
MSFLSQPVSLSHFLVVGAVLFVCGIVCMATKRNAIGVLMGVELVLNGAAINFVAFSSPFLRADSHLGPGARRSPDHLVHYRAGGRRGGVALAIVLCYYNTHATIDVDEGDELKG